MTDRVEILGFVDLNKSIDWAESVGVRVINLLTKGSLHHCREQLKKTHQQRPTSLPSVRAARMTFSPENRAAGAVATSCSISVSVSWG